MVWGCVLTSLIYMWLSQHHLLKRLSFSHCLSLPPLLKVDGRCVCVFLDSVLFHWSICLFVPMPYLFDYCSSVFVALFEVWECYSSRFFFPLRIALAILGHLWFHINFRVCSSSVKNVMGNLIVQSLICVQLFVIPWTAARQAFLSITNSQILLKLMSIESVMPSSHLILLSPSPPAFDLCQHQGLFK